jgi:hypothetical protein
MDRINNITEITEENALKSVLSSFVGSYVERDKTVDFSVWLAERIQQEIPYFRASAARELSGEIIEAVADYDRTLGELNRAIEAGQSKEEWLADRMAEVCDGMPLAEAGNMLQQIDSEWYADNARLMGETAVIAADAEIIEWNEYSVKSKALDIGRQAVMSGLGTAAMSIKRNMESGEVTDVNDLIGQALQTGVETAAGEVKAVVAGAVKTAVENKLTDILLEDLPVGYICDVAGVAVENAITRTF